MTSIALCTLKCLINGGSGGSEIFVNFNKGGGGVQYKRGRRKKSVNTGIEGKKRHKCLILTQNLKLSKQTRSEASMKR